MTQTDFTQNVIAMKNAGVKVLFIDQMAENYASALLKDLVQQNFHPIVVLGAATYSHASFRPPAVLAAVNGSYLDQNASLYLGEDQPSIPAVGTFLHWVECGLTGVHARSVHPVRMELGTALRPGPEERGLRSEPGIDPAGRCPRSPRYNGGNIVTTSNPVARTTSQLLSDRPSGQRSVAAAGRSSGEQRHQWVPLRLLVRDAAQS